MLITRSTPRFAALRCIRSTMLGLSLLAAVGGCASQGTLNTFYRLERSLAGLSEHSVQVADHRWEYAEGGQGEPVVLLHGFAASKEIWMRMVCEMPDGYRYVIPDLPGFGNSSYLPDADYDVASQVARLHAFVQQIGLTRFHLIGNSMGGNLAALYAASHPQQVASLALFAPSGVAQPTPSPYTRDYLERGQPTLVVGSRADYRRVFGDAFVDPPFVPGFILDTLADMQIARRDDYLRMYQQFWHKRTPLEPLLGQIGAPVLLLWGDQDRILDVSAAQVFKQGLPQAELVVWPNVGHTPMLEKAADSARLYAGFLSRNRHPAVAAMR